MLVAIAIFDLGMAISLLSPLIFLIMIGYWFIYIAHDEYDDNEAMDLQSKNPKIRYFLRLIDCREHAFSLPMILFVGIVLSFFLSKHFGLNLGLETSGNPRYVMSLPSGVFVTAGLVFASGFVYIFHHCDFFGIRQTKQSDEKVMRIHFSEIIICGATFLIWIMTICFAVLER